jgi:hypothetical protein
MRLGNRIWLLSSANVLQLGEVATCTNLIINREVSVAILPNRCYLLGGLSVGT